MQGACSRSQVSGHCRVRPIFFRIIGQVRVGQRWRRTVYNPRQTQSGVKAAPASISGVVIPVRTMAVR